MDKIPIVLLAAGGSSRMGMPKPLLQWGSKTLIEHQLLTLIKTGNPLVVVLGAAYQRVEPVVKEYNLSVVFNPNWEQGMGTSIAAGVAEVSKSYPAAEGVLIALIDQPLVTDSHYSALINAFQAGRQQIVASYSEQGWLGVPALYDRHYFEELMLLNAGAGAKQIIKKYPNKVIRVDAGALLDDMDTPEKYLHMVNKFAK